MTYKTFIPILKYILHNLKTNASAQEKELDGLHSSPSLQEEDHIRIAELENSLDRDAASEIQEIINSWSRK